MKIHSTSSPGVVKHLFVWPISISDVNTLRPRGNRRHFTDDIFKCIFLNENEWIPIKISLKFVPTSAINNIPVLVQIMAWRRPGDKLLSEPMMVNLPTHICVTRPQWVKSTLVQTMVLVLPANNPRLTRCWPSSMTSLSHNELTPTALFDSMQSV